MKVWAIQNKINKKYISRTRGWSDKSARMFSRLSDLSFHLNYLGINLGYYRGAPIQNVNIIELNLDTGERKEIKMSQWRVD